MNIAIIAAGGSGERMESQENKLLMEAKGKPVIWYTLSAFAESQMIDRIVVVGNERYLSAYEEVINGFDRPMELVRGGGSRQESVEIGVERAERFFNGCDGEFLVVHNGANPLVTNGDIKMSIEAAQEFGAAVVGRRAVNTIKRVDGEVAAETLERRDIFEAQTPQTINYLIFKEALTKAKKDGFEGTDDVSLVERLGVKVKCVESSEFNFKITSMKDFEYFTFLINKYGRAHRPGPR